MNKASRSVLQFVAVMFMAASLVLTACGDSTTPAPGTTAASGSTGATGASNPNVSGEIEMWHFWSSPQRRNAIRRVIAICKKQLPNLTVKDTVKPFSDIWTANTAAVAAGSGMPDVIVEDRPKLAQQAANNIETNLQTYVDRDKINSADYWPFTWKESQFNNGVYGIPYETDVRMLYWNKNAFKEAGLDPEKPPKTWDELEQYAAKLDKKNGDNYDRIGFFPLLGNGAGLQLWGWTNGVEWTKDAKVNVTDPKAVETLQWLKKWVDKYGGWNAWQKYNSQFTSPPQDAFMSGKVAMYLDINGYAGTLNFYRPQYTGADGKKVNLDYGVGDLPYKTTPANSSGGFALSIPKGSKKADAAWEFIKCATGQEAQISWARDTGSMPANVKAANDPVLLADPNWQVMLNGMKVTKNEDFIKGYSNWKEQLDKRFEKVWKGELEPKAALDEAQKAIDAEIAKNK